MITAMECATMHSRLTEKEIKEKYSWVISAINEFASRTVLEHGNDANQHPIPDASQPAAVPDEAGERIKQLEVLLNVTEQQRKEWADMCIKKQARIEELELQPAGNDAVRFADFLSFEGWTLSGIRDGVVYWFNSLTDYKKQREFTTNELYNGDYQVYLKHFLPPKP